MYWSKTRTFPKKHNQDPDQDDSNGEIDVSTKIEVSSVRECAHSSQFIKTRIDLHQPDNGCIVSFSMLHTVDDPLFGCEVSRFGSRDQNTTNPETPAICAL